MDTDVIMMTGGGTGGHLAIIKAVKEQLPYNRLVYVGSTSGQDKKWFENDGDFYKRYFLETRGVVNQNIFGKIGSIYLLLKAIKQSIDMIKELKPKVIFSVGGFSAAPMAYGARYMKIPLVIHEQNAHIGRLNQSLRPHAKYFISSYLEDSPVSAYPIKGEFFNKQRIRQNVKCIFFLGGSQGAVAINKLALSLAKELHEKGIKIIHQTGEANIEDVKKEYKVLGVEAKVFGYSDKISSYMNEADLAIARAGASTLWELSANGLPTVFIPYPYAAQDHQYHNAKFLFDQKLAWLMREEDIDEDKIRSILNTDLSTKSSKLMSIVETNGDVKIANLLKEFVD
ncbi:MAG: UDP-N-acetylglucosamine--N-acetylmuramyl-(pentapeptide) pyrophosphoryl-undecaprenol N-acetylglucosamine transferase [Campylobacterota bacterium]|nr:UDP-N-acetylglucosamine--N-acetylmuramyl-(pentapeptide) pyrophosphoryl-undecaprenol N-acetylglucosamine transferase [Campylobacterota bacterium]